MAKDLKILIIGFGSIGQRHYKNLKKLGYKNLAVFDINKKIISNIKSQTSNLNTNTLQEFRIVFICTPNNLHIKHALPAAKAGCHLFIEKPLSHNLTGINKLSSICQQKKLITMVACNLRFHPSLQFIKKYLEKNKLGKIYKISHEFGYYLPYWRPGTDYTKNYAVKKLKGGGIILDDIHEFDLLFWLNNFKPAKQAKFIYDKISKLRIETEDICLASFKFENNILGSVKCDYLQQSYCRTCKIVGEKGNLEWNWQDNIVWLKTKNQNKKIFQVKNWDVNQMYIDEVKYFMACVKNNVTTFNNIKRSKQVLKHCVRRK